MGSHHHLPGFMLLHNSHSMVSDTDFVSTLLTVLTSRVQPLKSHASTVAGTWFNLISHCGTVFPLLYEGDELLIGKCFPGIF